MRRRKWAWVAAGAALVACLAVVEAWQQRDLVWAWWESPAWATADEQKLDRVVESLGQEDLAVVRTVLLSSSGSRSIGCGQVLRLWLKQQNAEGPAPRQMLTELVRGFPAASAESQTQALLFTHDLLARLDSTAATDLHQLVANLVLAMPISADQRLPAQMRLFSLLMSGPQADRLRDHAKNAAQVAMTCADEGVRELAVRLAAEVGPDLLLPLISSSRPEATPALKGLVLLALGEKEGLLSTEMVLPFLHANDDHLRQTAEQILRVRGLTPAQVRLGRQLTDPRPMERAKVLVELQRLDNVDDNVWLERLSRDRSPVVRAAVVRYVQNSNETRWRSYVEQSANEDESLTLRAIARQSLREYQPK